MLGENHSLLNEFPKSKVIIEALVSGDDVFSADTKKYNELDTQIRTLELGNSPIDDETMHQLKHQRSELKDSLYQRILDAEK